MERGNVIYSLFLLYLETLINKIKIKFSVRNNNYKYIVRNLRGEEENLRTRFESFRSSVDNELTQFKSEQERHSSWKSERITAERSRSNEFPDSHYHA